MSVGDGECLIAEKLSGDPHHEHQWQKDSDTGERRGDHRRGDFLRSAIHRVGDGHAGLLVAMHGLKHDEYSRIVEHLGHEPNLLELGIFSVLWSEHCSYKSSRRYLKGFPTTGPNVLVGPGENAGVERDAALERKP